MKNTLEIQNIKKLLYADNIESFQLGLVIAEQEAFKHLLELKYMQKHIRSQKLRWHKDLIPKDCCTFGPDQGTPFNKLPLWKLVEWHNRIKGKPPGGNKYKRKTADSIWDCVGDSMTIRKEEIIKAIEELRVKQNVILKKMPRGYLSIQKQISL